MNTILWNANVETADSYLISDFSFFDTSPITFTAYAKNREVSASLIQYPNVKRLIAISEGWFILEQKDNRWYFNDLRFGLLPQKNKDAVFVFSYELKETNGAITATELPKTERDAQFLVSNLWQRIKGI
jgi:inner membrane protein